MAIRDSVDKLKKAQEIYLEFIKKESPTRYDYHKENFDKLILIMEKSEISEVDFDMGENSVKAVFAPKECSLEYDHEKEKDKYTVTGDVFILFKNENNEIGIIPKAKNLREQDLDSLISNLTEESLEFDNKHLIQVSNARRIDNLPILNNAKPSYDVNDSVSKRRDLLEMISDYKDPTIPRLVIDFSRFSSDLIYKNAFKFNYESVKDIVEDVISEFDQSFLDYKNNAIRQLENKQSKLANVNFDELPESKRIYPWVIRNFISSASSSDAIKYRKEFFDTSLKLLSGESEIANLPDGNIDQLVRSVAKLTFNESALRNQPDTIDEQVISLIDEGRYPSKLISEKNGFSKITKSEYSRAMFLYGTSRYLTKHQSFGSHLMTPESIKSAFSISKIPKSWLFFNDKIDDIYSFKGMSNINPSLQATIGSMMPFLINTGQEIERLKAEGDKLGLRELSKQWAWLSNSKKHFNTKIEEFSEKHKIEATFRDYPKLLEDNFLTVLRRVLLSVDDIDYSSAFSVDDDELTLDSNVIDSLTREYLNNNSTSEEPDAWDDDWGSYEVVEYCEFFGELEIPDQTDIKSMIHKGASFKEAAEFNSKIHKNYNTYLKRANKGSSKNISWTPLTNNPIELGEGLIAETITSRVDLLEEGHQMSHCAFSYLNKCISGESIILSVRKKVDDEYERVATVELTHDDDFVIEQCFGFDNKRTDGSNLSERLMEAWVDKANSGSVETNILDIKSNSVGMDDLVEKVEEDPMNEGSMLCDVPYESDAAYMAYYYFNEYTNKKTDISSLFFDNEMLGEVYSMSSFPVEINLIEELAKDFGVKPLDIVTYKMENKINALTDVRSHWNKRHEQIFDLEALKKEYSESLLPEQVAIKCISMMKSNYGIDLGAVDDVVNELQEQPSNWFKFIQSLPEKENPTPELNRNENNPNPAPTVRY